MLDVQAVALEFRAVFDLEVKLGLRTRRRFPQILRELGFEVGDDEILFVGLEGIPLEIRIHPVDILGERDLVDEDCHRSRLARFALVFALAHGEADFLNLVPLHVLGHFSGLVSVPSLTRPIEDVT